MHNEPPLSLEDLRARAARGERLRYLYFWGHRARRDGVPGPGCLSQWWPSAFTVAGERYATAEHWMMAGKARLFGDIEAAERILATAEPGAAKRLGRGVRGFDDEVWRERRFGIVVRGSVHKFGQNPEIGAYLRRTAARVLVEASPLDPVWGIGLAAGDERAADPALWPGENLLGFALMRARAELAAAAG
ncbi:NADAR family protein [Nocardiopsis mangrovi]|uniref:NADAR family protein n=1 Tax=Nocardiopsis mangrovi TaxID=1179818 RepID=A0ABV9E157_9ACTN